MTTNNHIQFHWRLVQGGEETTATSATQNEMGKAALPNLKLQRSFCVAAEKAGITSVLVDLNYGKPDPIMLTTALAMDIPRLGFIIAVRSGLLSPTLFTQQINTLSTLTNGRIFINVVAGHSPAEQKIYGDFLNHDERYARTDDFLNICTRFWNKETPVNVNGDYIQVEGGLLNTPYVSDKTERPFIFVAGGSQPAIDLTMKYGDCWMQLADTPAKLQAKVKPVLDRGKAAGIRLSVICRETNSEALQAANDLLQQTTKHKEKQKDYVTKSDSKSISENHLLAEDEWPSKNLWTGAVKTIGPTAVSIVGSYQEVASKFMEFKQAGITHFIISAWPKLTEMERFGEHVIPLIRAMENKEVARTHN